MGTVGRKGHNMTERTSNISPYDLHPFKDAGAPATLRGMSLLPPAPGDFKDLESALLDHNPKVPPEVALFAGALRRYKDNVRAANLY
jgi:hypothetical protein